MGKSQATMLCRLTSTGGLITVVWLVRACLPENNLNLIGQWGFSHRFGGSAELTKIRIFLTINVKFTSSGLPVSSITHQTSGTDDNTNKCSESDYGLEKGKK